MELRQLRYFLVVADELHFGRAAERLHVAQASLSYQIKQLETALGAALLHRTTRRVELTAVGAELRHRLAPLVAELDQAVSDLGQVEAGHVGTLRVGFVSSASYTVVPEALRRFRRLAPRVDLQLEPLTSAEQIDRLFDGTIDLGLLRAEHIEGLHCETLLVERLVACLPSDHPVADAGLVTPEQLASIPMISFPRRSMPAFAQQVRDIFARTTPPSVAQMTIHQETALGLVAGGLGFTILPESVSRLEPTGVTVLLISTDPTSSMLVATDPHRASVPRSATIFRTCLHEAASAARTRHG